MISYINDENKIVQVKHSPNSETLPASPGKNFVSKKNAKRITVAKQSIEDINGDIRLKNLGKTSEKELKHKVTSK